MNISAEALQSYCVRVLRATGVSEEDAVVAADSLVDADLRGLDTHGVPARLPNYVKRLRSGGIVPDATVRVTADEGAVVVLDAGGGLGQVAGVRGMEAAISKAADFGVGVAAVRDSNHLGALAYYSRMALEHTMVGAAMSGAAPGIAPWGGTEKLLGSNPWSLAFPTGDRPPLVVDISNGVVIYGKIRAAMQRGESIPPGWALDPRGRPTEDAAAAVEGSLFPFGGVKGAALTLALEALVSVLTGGAFSRQVPELGVVDQPQRLGQLFIAFDVNRFLPRDVFEERMDQLLSWAQDSPPAEGFDEVRIPGARSEAVRRQRLEDGIPLDGREAALDAVASEVGVDPLTGPDQG